ncbi:MAG TPA: OmpH family outer membrane protein [Candidatus Hydrogenedens sp.]|nr:OmpH family outer membrane protein [Candidatus Hydrogenedens sp.]HOL18899.1 OmpH family outer membrane protein [Candidatus Hydrogenedens sp.]HPP57601.1 OmpH family outer membrane protein [Candidatus Hydrogenedens sp.]
MNGRYFFISLTICILLLLPVGMIFAQEPVKTQSSEASYRIAVVDVELVMREYNKRKQKYEELQKEVDSQQKELDNLMSRIEEDRKKLESGKSTMSDEEKLDLKMKIEQEAATYRAELEKRQKTIDSKEERIIRECLDDIQNAINVIATSDNYHLVFNAGKSLKSSLLFHSPTMDITSKVLTYLNSNSSTTESVKPKK